MPSIPARPLRARRSPAKSEARRDAGRAARDDHLLDPSSSSATSTAPTQAPRRPDPAAGSRPATPPRSTARGGSASWVGDRRTSSRAPGTRSVPRRSRASSSSFPEWPRWRSQGNPTTISASGSWPGSRHDISPMCYVVNAMSTRVGIRELRQQASAVLRRVVGGETIDVTDHGHPIARIVPLRPGIIDQMVLDGRATGARGDLMDLADQMGLPTDASGPVLPSVALAQLRSDER